MSDNCALPLIANISGPEKFADDTSKIQAFPMSAKCVEAEQICQQLGGRMARITEDNLDQMLSKFLDKDAFKTQCRERIWTSSPAGN